MSTQLKYQFDVEKEKKAKVKRIKRIAKIFRRCTTITWHQEEAMRILDLHNIEYVSEKQIFHHESFYLVDLYLPAFNMCVEIDGSSHDDPRVAENDRVRDAVLRNLGYWVFRIRNQDIKVFWKKLGDAIRTSKWVIRKYGSFNKNP